MKNEVAAMKAKAKQTLVRKRTRRRKGLQRVGTEVPGLAMTEGGEHCAPLVRPTIEKDCTESSDGLFFMTSWEHYARVALEVVIFHEIHKSNQLCAFSYVSEHC